MLFKLLNNLIQVRATLPAVKADFFHFFIKFGPQLVSFIKFVFKGTWCVLTKTNRADLITPTNTKSEHCIILFTEFHLTLVTTTDVLGTVILNKQRLVKSTSDSK